MATLEELQAQIAALQAQLAALEPIKFAPGTGTPYANPALREGVAQFDYAKFARDNPAEARKITLSMVDAMLGGPAKPTPERDMNLARWQEDFNSAVHVGTSGIDAASLTLEERVWLYYQAEGYRGDLHRVVLSGRNVDMSRAKSDGFHLRGQIDPRPVRDVLVAAVSAAKAAQ